MNWIQVPDDFDISGLSGILTMGNQVRIHKENFRFPVGIHGSIGGRKFFATSFLINCKPHTKI
jgi:hypothetical protein